MVSNQISKVYYARVYGDFSKCNGLDSETKEITVENQIYCISFIDAIWECNQSKDVPFEYQ